MTDVGGESVTPAPGVRSSSLSEELSLISSDEMTLSGPLPIINDSPQSVGVMSWHALNPGQPFAMNHYATNSSLKTGVNRFKLTLEDDTGQRSANINVVIINFDALGVGAGIGQGPNDGIEIWTDGWLANFDIDRLGFTPGAFVSIND